jgi:hypothetical protein
MAPSDRFDPRRTGLPLRALLPVLLALLAAAWAAPAAAAPGLPSGRVEYAIFRDGERIGTEVNEFTRVGARTLVRTHTEIAVEVLFVVVYRFTLDVEESWVGDQLVALHARADDDGERAAVDLQRADGASPRPVLVNFNGRTSAMPDGVMPTSMWHPASVHGTDFVDVLDGRHHVVAVTPRGTEMLEIGGRAVKAERYAMRGGIARDLWYGPQGLLKVSFAAEEDGSQITLIRTRP